MSKYTFICEEESMPYSIVVESKKTVEFRADSLEDVLLQFESFLRGSGFIFDGYLDIVNDDIENLPEEYVDDVFGGESNSATFDFSDIPKNNWPFGTLVSVGAVDSESEVEEKCSVCKLPKSVMKAEKCYDGQCPKTSWLNDLDYKIASEK